jgi:hypothetical protein
MNKKLVTQNPDRYTKEGAQWKISASPNIKPIYLPKGVEPSELLPLLTVDGIIVEVGEYKLISQNTLDYIKEYDNPHYDIVQNGEVMGKPVGKTIRTIKVNLDSLSTSANERDILNRNAGVASVEYIYESNPIPNTGLSQNLVDQINYTLNPNYNRPKDTYNLAELQLGPADAYDIRPFNALNNQDLENNIFSYGKLEDYLNTVKEKQINLQRDFSLIKEVFWEGKLPTELTTYKITKMATAEDKLEEGDIQIVYKNSQPILNIVPKAPENENVQLPKIATSDIAVYAVAGRKGSFVGVSQNDPTTGAPGKTSKYYSGKQFLGAKWKVVNGKQIYKVYDTDGIRLLGYIVEDRKDAIVQL